MGLCQKHIGHGIRIGFHGDFRIWRDGIPPPQLVQCARDARTAQQAGRAAAEVNCIDGIIGTVRRGLDELRQQAVHIGIPLLRLSRNGIEITVGTFCRAERHMDIDTQLILHPA